MAIYHGYARISTEDQSDFSIENQLEYLKMKAEEIGLPFEGHSEKQSGKNFDTREVLKNIVEKAKAGDYVGFYDNSRLGRNTIESLSIVDKLTNKDVKVQIGGATFDKKVPRDELLFTIESAISTFYRKEQKLKSEIGIRQKKSHGEWIFTSRLYGYKVTFEGSTPKVEVVEEEAEVIRYIFKEYAKGRSIRDISISLNNRGIRTRDGGEFHAATVRRYILKPIYKGYYLVEGAGSKKGQDKVEFDEEKLVKSKYYPPIVDEELWDRVYKSYRTLTRKHSQQFEYRFSHYELSGILKCYYCKRLGKATGYAHGYKKLKSGKTYANYVNHVHLPGCEQYNHTFRASILEGLFEACFYLLFMKAVEIGEYVAAQRQKIEEEVENIDEDIKRIRTQLATVKKKQKHYVDAIGKGVKLDLIQPELDKLEKEENQLNRSLEEYSNHKNEVEADIENILEEYSENTLLKFINSTAPNKRTIFRNMIQAAWVFNGQIIIRYTNSKVFVIPLIKNRGRYVQTIFNIKTYYLNRYQYTFQYGYNKNDIDLIDVSYNKVAWQNEPELLKGYIGDHKDLLKKLKKKIQKVRKTPTK
jgi:site-specific DNA recombinase